MSTLIISNLEMNDIMKIVKSLGRIWFINKIKNGAKEQKGGFLGMLLGTLGTSYIREFNNR